MAQSNTLQYSCLTSLPSAPIDSKNSTYNSQDSEAKHMHSSIEGTPLSKQPVLPHVPVLEKNTPTSDQENFKFDSSFLHSNQKDLSTSDHLSKNDKLEHIINDAIKKAEKKSKDLSKYYN